MDSKITKREHFAAMALQGMLMSQNLTLRSIETISISRMKVLANMAVDAADLLIVALEETPPKEKDLSIFDAEFSTRTLNGLRALAQERGIKEEDMTLLRITEFTEGDILRAPLMGKKSLYQIKDTLAIYNLRLRYK